MTYLGDLPYPEVKQRILNCADKQKQLLFALTYVTGSRIGEIVRHHLDVIDTPIREMHNPPLKDTNIFKKRIKGNLMIAVRIQVEKSKEKRFRIFPIPTSKETEYCKILWKAKKRKEKVGGGYLLDISTRTAQKQFQETFPEFDQGIHHLRHWRITHLLSGAAWGKRVPKDKVQKLVGHSRLTTTNLYDHVEIENWMEEFI